MIYSAGYASATLEIHTYEPESDESKGLHSVFIRVPSNHFQNVYANKVLKGLSEFNINDFIDIDEDSPPKELRGYPMFAALCSLTKLTEVSVKQSNLVGCIPHELQVLTSLKTLILSGNDIQGCIPSELGLLSNLEYLNLCKNRNLSGPFPPELGALKKLLSMDLSFTSLTGPIPPTWGQLENLQRLQLQGNKGLCGAIPSELGNMNP
ncbi:L domain-like protein [Rhizoclosmatium globosum]|uniref:L domain-like protein n=1 Tax=Rhizoclosmatium globosum TaxID=329046 RepID=A0A1Y2CVJ3_9FUNG|nr:L domain-like protein [Rhizoclosmatium globosum]|eukprot:ORY51070.1 L domain-like protein [Rhizoclosmatium globosum]